jgi:3-isopropylmalate/(R)-2-methylmalate dehydratase large subunit
MGLALPGLTVAIGDSHTCTHGAVGALAWGVGQGELVHILATQTCVQHKPRTMRVTLEGTLPAGVSGKDLILFLIGRLGVAAGNGYAVEYAGAAVRALPMEARRDAGLDGALLLTSTGTLFDDLSESEDASEDADGMPYGGGVTRRGGQPCFPDLTARGDGAPNQLRLDVGAVLNAWRCAGGRVAAAGETQYCGGDDARRLGGSLGRQLPSPYARPAPPKPSDGGARGSSIRAAAA